MKVWRHRDNPYKQNVPQPKAFYSISQDFQEHPYSNKMAINDNGEDSLSNPPSQRKNMVIICPKCDGK